MIYNFVRCFVILCSDIVADILEWSRYYSISSSCYWDFRKRLTCFLSLIYIWNFFLLRCENESGSSSILSVRSTTEVFTCCLICWKYILIDENENLWFSKRYVDRVFIFSNPIPFSLFSVLFSSPLFSLCFP